MNYQSPEVVEIGRANEVILGSKIGDMWDQPDEEFTLPESTILDRDE